MQANSGILFITENALNVSIIQRGLHDSSFSVHLANSWPEWLGGAQKTAVDLVILCLDIIAPDSFNLAGTLALVEAISPKHPVCILINLAKADEENRKAADTALIDFFERGAEDVFISYRPLHLPLHFNEKLMNRLENISKRKHLLLRIAETDLATITVICDLAECRDKNTGDHVSRVQRLSSMLAAAYPNPVPLIQSDDIPFHQLVGLASSLHDIGKVETPDRILLKEEELTGEEWSEMEKHTTKGAEYLEKVCQRSPSNQVFQLAKEIALSHHEKFDGSGYPNGLHGNDIPIEVKIVTIADAYDAMTNPRCYRKKPKSHMEACEVIQKDTGTHFAPEVADVFFKIKNEIVRG
jgi:Response regulator containing a CheY-like receiver domain and an HD-GYP domain